MRPPRRSTQLRNPNALSPRSTLNPPGDSRVTIGSYGLRIRRVPTGVLATQLQAFSEDHPLCRRIPFFVTYSGRPRPVVEIAKKLVGHFLISRASNVVMQIVETEAYSEHEQIYRNRFPGPPPAFRNPAGRLVSHTFGLGRQHMFITAGADDSGDLVLLRTCSVIYGLREIADRVQLVPVSQSDIDNMMSGPTKVGMALAPELGSPYNLLTPSRRLNLLQQSPGNPLIMFEGRRILPRDTPHLRYSAMPGANSRFRFALDTDQKLQFRRTLGRSN